MGNGARGLSLEFSPSPFIMANQFDTLGVNVKSFREPLMRSIRQVMVPSIKQTFETAGRGDWNELLPHTVARREVEGYGPEPILIRSGRLKRVATQQNIWKIDGPRGEAYIDSLPDNAWYGVIHQAGAETLYGGIMARPWAVMYEEDMNEIEVIFFEWIEERINRDITLGRRASF